MRLSVVAGVIGQLLRLFWPAFLPPLGLALADGDARAALEFGGALAICVALGLVLTRVERAPRDLVRAEAFAIVAGSWLVVGAVGAVPYLFAGLRPLDALFESISGFTTTGATVLTDFETHGRAFFLWRAMTQWFGGLGIIALFVVVLPRLGVAGRQLFFAEASISTGHGIAAHVRGTARRLWVLYLLLTGALVASLVATGFPPYDATVHAFTTISAGGFSPSASSLAAYQSPASEWVLVLFMVLASTSFPLQWRALAGRPLALLRDEEFRAYLAMLLLLTVALALVLGGLLPTAAQWRASAFQIASLASSTGFASVDYEALWPASAKALLLLAMLMGGCAGSACGGPKVIRYLLTLRFLRREMRQAIHPQGVLPVRYGSQVIEEPVLRSIVTLVGLFLAGYVVLGLVLPLVDPQVSVEVGLACSIACLGNIGPGLGFAGPMGSFATLNDGAKALLTLAMWLGRLEIISVLALLQGDVLRRLRWRDSPRGQPSPSA